VKIELLPVNRWPEIDKALQESRSDESLPNPENSVMLGAFDGDRLIGCIGAEKVWCVSPFWIERDYRGNGLALAMARALTVCNEEGFREMCATTNPHVEKLIHRLGFIPVEGQLWRRDK
jgi:GNAT superfamily N-acetyltransferase